MMVTDLALQDMADRGDATLQRFFRWVVAPFRSTSPVASFPAESPTVSTRVQVSPLPATLPPGTTSPDVIDFAHHRAANAARRAMQLARSHRYDEARSAFHSAMVADPRIDPGSLPGFWDLPRRGMFSAIEACEDLGRYHAAALLEVRILQASRPVTEAARASSPALATH